MLQRGGGGVGFCFNIFNTFSSHLNRQIKKSVALKVVPDFRLGILIFMCAIWLIPQWSSELCSLYEYKEEIEVVKMEDVNINDFSLSLED